MDKEFYISSGFYWHDLLAFLIVYQSVIFTFFLLAKPTSHKRFKGVLTAIYVTILCHFSYMLLESYVGFEPLMLGAFFGLFYGPLFYFYTSSLLHGEHPIRKMLLHFSPAVVLLISILIALQNGLNWNSQNEIILSGLVTIHIITYLDGALAKIGSFRKRLPVERSNISKIDLAWLKMIIYFIFVAIGLAFTESLVSSIFPFYNELLLVVIFCFILGVVNCLYYFGYRQAKLFTGFSIHETSETTEARKYDIGQAEKKILVEKLATYMEESQPYKEFELSLADLASELNTTPRKLSLIINETYQINFFEYINDFRLKEAKRLLRNPNSSIKEAMYSSGFGNKSSFNSAFKRATGLTPTEFKKSKS